MIKQVKIHSSYNPQKEAVRFCDTIKENPQIIIITEPGESYLAPVLRKRFPCAKLISMRYSDTYFLDSDKLWDNVWRPASGNPAFFLINNIPDEFLFSTIFLPWKPAENIWPQAANSVWKAISDAVKIIQSIIATRVFFGKKWLKNMGDNFVFTENYVCTDFFKQNLFVPPETNYFFAGAGPSLDQVLDNCKESIAASFSLSAASAIPAFTARNINLNLCVSTDGGFWAGNHLKYLTHPKLKKTALAFPLEAKIPYEVLKSNPCLFLTYNSALESLFFANLGIIPISAKRNGSVSGTAIDLLLDNTIGNIFIAGLDLKESKGFSHCTPHESQKLKASEATRFEPISNFAAVSNFDIRSLKTYEKWFAQIPKLKANRLFRIGKDLGNIGNIKSISEEDFKSNVLNQKKSVQFQNKMDDDTLKIKSNFSNSKKINLAEKKHLLSNIYKSIQTEIRNKTFFDKIFFDKKKLNEKEKKTVEKELCEFISFQNYMNFLKEINSSNEKEIKLKLEEEIKGFLENEIKRLGL